MKNGIRLAAIAVALAIAPPAHAERAKKNAAGATAPAKTPAPAASAPARPQPPPPPSEPRSEDVGAAPARGFFASRGPGSIAVGVGAWSGGGANGVAFHVDYGFLRTPPTWRTLQLEWRVAAMVARPTQKTDLSRNVLVGTIPTVMPTGVEKTSAYVLEVAPMARLRWAVSDKLALFVDAGAGIAQTFENVDRDEMYVGRTVTKENVTGVVLRGAVGLSFDVSERMRVLFIPLAYSAELGAEYSGFEPTIALGYRL